MTPEARGTGDYDGTSHPDQPKVWEFRSDQSSTVLYACSLCGLVIQSNTREQAERCCLCIRCDKPVEKRFRTMCEEHAAEHRAEQDARRRASAESRPVVEHDGPVYVADVDRFYESAEEAAEALWDDDMDPTTAVAHPCSVGPVAVPDLVSTVDEAWGEQFEDGYDGLPTAAKDLLLACEKALAPLAPTIWLPMTGKRVVLPVVTIDEGVRG